MSWAILDFVVVLWVVVDCFVFLFYRMRAHVANATSSPILIFPEGTCVNNEYTVLFHKGAFELDAQICPVAIKYVNKSGVSFLCVLVFTN